MAQVYGEIEYDIGLVDTFLDTGPNGQIVTTTKGDLVVSNGTRSVRFPVGVSGSVLCVNPTPSGGIVWDSNIVRTAPEGSIPNSLVKYTDSSGKFVRNGNVTLDDNNNMAGLGNVSSSGNISLNNSGSIFLYNGSAAVELKASPGMSSNVDIILPATNGASGQALVRFGNSGNTIWKTITEPNPLTSLPVNFRFNDPNGNPTSVSSTSFVTLASFIYRGTLLGNIIIQILAITNVVGGNAQGQIRIFDFTNGNIIATSAIYSNGTKSIVDFGTITNLPSAISIFEIQMRRVNATGGGSVELHSVQAYG